MRLSKGVLAVAIVLTAAPGCITALEDCTPQEAATVQSIQAQSAIAAACPELRIGSDGAGDLSTTVFCADAKCVKAIKKVRKALPKCKLNGVRVRSATKKMLEACGDGEGDGDGENNNSSSGGGSSPSATGTPGADPVAPSGTPSGVPSAAPASSPASGEEQSPESVDALDVTKPATHETQEPKETPALPSKTPRPNKTPNHSKKHKANKTRKNTTMGGSDDADDDGEDDGDAATKPPQTHQPHKTKPGVALFPNISAADLEGTEAVRDTDLSGSASGVGLPIGGATVESGELARGAGSENSSGSNATSASVATQHANTPASTSLSPTTTSSAPLKTMYGPLIATCVAACAAALMG